MSAPFAVYSNPDNPFVLNDDNMFPPRDEIPTHIIVQSRKGTRDNDLSEMDRPHFYIHPLAKHGHHGRESGNGIAHEHSLMYRPIGSNKYELMTMPDDIFPPMSKICTVMGITKIWFTKMDYDAYNVWVSSQPDSFMEQARFFIKAEEDACSNMIAWVEKAILNNGTRHFANIVIQCLDADDERTWADELCKKLYDIGFEHHDIEWHLHPSFTVRRPDLRGQIGAA